MATDFKRGDTGINTAEGQISGPRAARLAKQRQEDQKEYENKRQKIQVGGMVVLGVGWGGLCTSFSRMTVVV